MRTSCRSKRWPRRGSHFTIGALVLVWLALCPVGTWSASAVIVSEAGNRPVRDAGWPEGALAVANLQARIGWWEGPPFGGGEYHFVYQGNTLEFADALAKFGAIITPLLDLVIHDGPGTDLMFKTSGRVDWTFTVWVPASWNRLYNNPELLFNASSPNFRQPVASPRLDVYIGEGGIDWAQVKVPGNIRVRDERASASGLDLSGGSVLEVQLFDMDTGKPVSGAHLLAESMAWMLKPEPHWDIEQVAEGFSDASGRVRLQNLPAGTIRFKVTAQGYTPRFLEGPRAHPHPTVIKFTVELAKAVGLRGIVVDAENNPLSNAKVRPLTLLGSNGLGYNTGLSFLPYDTFVVATDASGHFELAGLPTGFAQVTVTAPGYRFEGFRMIHEVPSTNLVLRLSRSAK